VPKVIVEAKTSLSQEEAFRKVKELLQTDPDLKKMDPSCVFTFNDAKASGSAKAKMFAAEMTVLAEHAGASVKIEVDLPLMLTPAKGIVQSTLERKVAKALTV
jgi:hypothetical protein